MTEKQFLQDLEHALDRLPAEERSDILQDLREYFSNGRADGKTDVDIAAELGDPAEIAEELIGSYDFNQTEVPALNIDMAKDKFDNVNIQIENGLLVISPSNDGQLHVDLVDKNYKQQLAVNIEDRTLVISLTEEEKFWGIFSISRSMNTPTLTVQLPDKLFEKIQISSENGSINGERLAASVFEVETENGSIDLSQIGAGSFTVNSENRDVRLTKVEAKSLEAETENGQIRLKEIDCGKVQAVSDNGAITLKEVEGDVTAQTDNGRIHLVAADLERIIKLETDNGAVLLETRTPPKNATILADVDWGSISVLGSKNRKTVFGDGQHPIVLQSGNGSVTVKLID